jgi:hypothetical protein
MDMKNDSTSSWIFLANPPYSSFWLATTHSNSGFPVSMVPAVISSTDWKHPCVTCQTTSLCCAQV